MKDDNSYIGTLSVIFICLRPEQMERILANYNVCVFQNQLRVKFDSAAAR